MPGTLVRLLRVKQWTKNGFVAVPLIFASTSVESLLAGVLSVAVAMAAFCLVSSAIYIWNDIVDVESDRLHPVKCRRPIASGQISATTARVLSLVLAVVGLALAASINSLVLLGTVLYVANNVTYNLGVKHLQLLDVFSISVGFILRVWTGAAAISVEVSNYLFLTVFFITLFLGVGKRRHELMLLGESSTSHRRVLQHYSVYYLDQLMLLAATMTLAIYALYVLERQTLWLTLTIPVVTLGLFRYFHITHNLHGGEPSDDLVADPYLLATGAVYGALVLTQLAFPNHVG